MQSHIFNSNFTCRVSQIRLQRPPGASHQPSPGACEPTGNKAVSKWVLKLYHISLHQWLKYTFFVSSCDGLCNVKR